MASLTTEAEPKSGHNRRTSDISVKFKTTNSMKCTAIIIPFWALWVLVIHRPDHPAPPSLFNKPEEGVQVRKPSVKPLLSCSH